MIFRPTWRRARRALMLATVMLVGVACATVDGTPTAASRHTQQTSVTPPPGPLDGETGADDPNVTPSPSDTAPTSSHPADPTDPPTSNNTPPSAPSAPSATPIEGSDGAGDPYYPQAGNGGYQVDSYSVQITYDPPSGHLDGRTTVAATVTADSPLSRFNLDLDDRMEVTSVTVGDEDAEFAHEGGELSVTPAAPLEAGAVFSVVVGYDGVPGLISGGTSGLGDGGWYRTADGGAIAAGEPFSASAWFPANEHPSDPAAFSVTATVPLGWEVVSVGTRFDGALPIAPDGMHSVRYDIAEPIATYLTTIMIGKLELVEDDYDGLPIVNVFAGDSGSDREVAAHTPQVLDVLSDYFGPYPYDSYGGIYTDERLSFALETATRPVYGSGVSLSTVIHETAHQWFGNTVMVATWADVCLNECFASYAPWLYIETAGADDLDELWQRQMDRYAANPGFWRSPLVDMGAGQEFTSVYDRGPLAVHALRREMGDAAFREMLRGWIDTYRGQNASFEDFEAYVSQVAGRDLTDFIDVWFRGTTVPDESYWSPQG